MNEKFLVLTGNEFGLDLGNMTDLKFRNADDAEDLYKSYLEEYDCAGMWKVELDQLILVKSEDLFNG